MKKITFSPSFNKKLKEIKRKNPRLFQKISHSLQQFQRDSQYPALRRHKLEGNLQNVWSISVTMSIRMLFVEDDKYYFFDIGTHDQVYRR